MPTPYLDLPVFTTSDTSKLDTLLNSITSALDTGVQSKLLSIGVQRGPSSGRIAAAATATKGDLWSDTTDDLLYRYNGTRWLLLPGQMLATMTGPTASVAGPAGTLVGTVASTPTLPVGQRVKVMAGYSQYSSGSGSASFTRLQARNNAANVTYVDYDKLSGARGYSSFASGVHDSVTPLIMMTTSVAEKVSAGIYIASGTTGVYGTDGIELWIESA